MKWCHLWNMLIVLLSMEIRSFEETLNRWQNFPVIVVTYYSLFKNSNIVSDSKLSPTFNLCQACDLRTSRWGWGDSLFFDLSSAAMWVWGSASSLPLGHPILFIFVSNLSGTGVGNQEWLKKEEEFMFHSFPPDHDEGGHQGTIIWSVLSCWLLGSSADMLGLLCVVGWFS